MIDEGGKQTSNLLWLFYDTNIYVAAEINKEELKQ